MKLFKRCCFAILLLLPLLTIANTGKRTGKHTKEKTIHKEYTVLPNTELVVWNSYGNIDIITWDKDKISVDIQIIVNGNNEKKVNDALKQIHIDSNIKSNKKKLLFETKGLHEMKEHKEIHYQIRVPKTSKLGIYNQYGNITINETDGDVFLSAGYGSVIAGRLNSLSSIISTSYSQGSSVDFAKVLVLSSYYADFKIEKADNFKICVMQSSNITAGTIGNLIYEDCNYGTLNIGSVVWGIKGESEYLTTNIGEIKKHKRNLPVNIKAKYGSLNIKKWDVKNANFDVYGTRLSLGYSDEIPFDLNLNVKGCIISTTIGALPKTVQDNLITISEKEYSGYHIKKHSNRKLNIKIAKGTLRFNKVENPLALK